MSGAKFQTVLCDTDESCSIHYQIRYQVYCRETGFEDPEEFADGKRPTVTTGTRYTLLRGTLKW